MTRLRKTISVFLSAVMLTAGILALPSFAVYAAPDDGGRVPYHFAFEKLHTEGCSDTKISVLRDLELESGQPLEAAGWVATDEGISDYLYMWVPAGGGVAGEWESVTTLQIIPRPDLAPAGIAYPSGHSTAGFSFTIEPPKGTPEGYYDIYIRALDGMGTPCDLAALLNLRYGEPDRVSEEGVTVSFPRIGREGEAALTGGASADGGLLRLPPDGAIRLGQFNLAAFEAVRISYAFPDTFDGEGKPTSVLGLKSSGRYSYGKDDEAYNTTHSLAYTALTQRKGEVTIDLTQCDESGELWLTGHLGQDLLITEIQLIHTGYGTDRVAALIQLGGPSILGYCGSFNRTEAKTVTDPELGEVLRLQVTESTNDPYAHFRAGDLLRDHGIILSAGEYKYMVLLYRADAGNSTNRMNLYLCAGRITGATEECNQGEALIADGQWHYLLVNLAQKENWEGIIHGWRFDYISGQSEPGQGVEFATVQFFRTLTAAQEAAKQDPLSRKPYRPEDPVVVKDMREEAEQEGFTMDPEDTYEVTEPPAEPPTEPSTEPPVGTLPDEPANTSPLAPEDTERPAETTPSGKGCRSALCSVFVFPILSIPALVLRKRKKSNSQRRTS